MASAGTHLALGEDGALLNEAKHFTCLAVFAACGPTWLMVVELLVQLPAFLFLVFLAYTARRSWHQLSDPLERSPVLCMYYVLLWVVCVMNVIRASVELSAKNCNPGSYFAWDLVWVLTHAGMFFLEVSVVIFLALGYKVSGHTALVKAAALSAVVTLVAVLFRTCFMWLGHMKLYGTSIDGYAKQQPLERLAFWGTQTLLCLGVYVAILALPYTKPPGLWERQWRDRLPARQSFYWYIVFLAALNAASFLAALLMSVGVIEGYCLYALCMWMYYTFYPPAVYVTFLADFFQDDDVLEQESAFYSEMRDAGYFSGEDDWW